MMKRILLLFVTIVCLGYGAWAQDYTVLDQVLSDKGKAAGMEAPYRFESLQLTRAPRGYKAFYVSHYGRHGSRYAWSSRTYKLLYKVLSTAHEKGLLTPYGEDFYGRYQAFYQEPLLNTGDLVELGAQQHARIARRMSLNFPEVFYGNKKVDARSSTAARCILSMAAFTTSLQKWNSGLDISVASTHTGMAQIVPPSAPAELVKKYAGMGLPEGRFEKPGDFARRKVDYDGILGKFFTDRDFLKEFDGGETEFLNEFYGFMGNYPNYAPEELFADALTPQQWCGLWEANNFGVSFLGDLDARFRMIPLLEDIVSKADEALASQDIAAHLRFGHDYILEAFNCLINLNGCGTVPEKADDVKYWFQSYNIPKAANIQLVFYRSRSADKPVLFKVLWNEKEATLPDLQPVEGPYYSWEDFKAFAAGIIAAHPAIN